MVSLIAKEPKTKADKIKQIANFLIEKIVKIVKLIWNKLFKNLLYIYLFNNSIFYIVLNII